MLNLDPMERDGVRLMPYAPAHDLQTVTWLNDPLVREGFGLTREVTLTTHRAWMKQAQDLAVWAILDRSGAHAGNLLLHLERRRSAAYLQMYIGPLLSRGQGLGWNALLCALEWAFEHEDLNRVWLHVLPENQAAINLYEKAGFRKEGIEREALFRNGAFQDQYRFSLLRREWRDKALRP